MATRKKKTLPGLPQPALICSFCGHNEHERCIVIAGPDAFICEECVWSAADILAEKNIQRKS